jgi:hypothetical protein
MQFNVEPERKGRAWSPTAGSNDFFLQADFFPNIHWLKLRGAIGRDRAKTVFFSKETGGRKRLFAGTKSKSRVLLKIVKMQPVFLVFWCCAKGVKMAVGSVKQENMGKWG